MARAQRAPHVLEHRRRGEAPLGATRRRDDAIGAEERAAVLDLDERASSLDRRAAVVDALDLDTRQGRQRAIHAGSRTTRDGAGVPDQPLELRDEAVLAAVVDEAGGRIGLLEGRPADLDRATGHDDLGVRVQPPGAADGVARLCVGLAGDRAGVDERRGRRLPMRPTRPTPRSRSMAGGRFHLGLVDLAAEVDDRRAPDRPDHAGCRHHSAGFVLIRKPIVPTRPAIA